jgi:hypothetical protein
MRQTARQIRCPVSYGAQISSNYGRMDELRMRRLYPELGKALSEAEEDEEIQLTAGYVAYYESQRGKRRERIKKLLRKQPRSAKEQRELDRLCRHAHEDGENWPSRWEILTSKAAFERTPAEILELDALRRNDPIYEMELAKARERREFQLQQRTKNPDSYKLEVPLPCPACREPSENLKQESLGRRCGTPTLTNAMAAAICLPTIASTRRAG